MKVWGNLKINFRFKSQWEIKPERENKNFIVRKVLTI